MFELPYGITRRNMYGKIRVIGAEKPDKAHYQAEFSFVGEDVGVYELVTVTNEAIVLTGTATTFLSRFPVQSGSEVVTNTAGTVTYVRDVDYVINYADGGIARTAVGSAISSGQTVHVDYTYVDSDRVLFVEIPELDSDAKCQTAANQMGNDMIRRTREASFVAVGNPFLQVGDTVQVIESSTTISELYRILSLELELDAEGFMIMSITAYHYGFAPL